MASDRLRRRQGQARMRGGVPYSDSDSTLSLLPGAAMGEWIARQAPYVRGDLLDAGCGNQPFASWYRPLVRRVVALDAAQIDGIEVVGFVDRIPFRDASFDTVLATEVLEHVTNAEQAMDECARVLRPGGHLLVTVPFLYPTHEAPYDFRRLTHFGLRALIERHGLDVVSLDAKGGPILLVLHAAVLALVGALDAVGRMLRTSRPFTDHAVVRMLIAGPQEAAIRLRAGRAAGLRGGAGLASLGYMAVARKP